MGVWIDYHMLWTFWIKRRITNRALLATEPLNYEKFVESEDSISSYCARTSGIERSQAQFMFSRPQVFMLE
jgi:hypothetical protein